MQLSPVLTVGLVVWPQNMNPAVVEKLPNATITSLRTLTMTVIKTGAVGTINKKASIRSQDSARRQFQAGLRGDVGPVSYTHLTLPTILRV